MTKLTQKNSKYATALAASAMVLLVVLILPTNSAFAAQDWTAVPKLKANQTVTTSTSKQISPMSIIATIFVNSAACNHYATLANKCYGFDSQTSSFYYNTPATFVNPNICSGYTCEDTDLYLQYPNTITYSGYLYTWSSGSERGCANNLVPPKCSNLVTWTDPYSVDLTQYRIPTSTPIQYTSSLNYVKGSNTVVYQFTNYLTYGYS